MNKLFLFAITLSIALFSCQETIKETETKVEKEVIIIQEESEETLGDAVDKVNDGIQSTKEGIEKVGEEIKEMKK